MNANRTEALARENKAIQNLDTARSIYYRAYDKASIDYPTAVENASASANLILMWRKYKKAEREAKTAIARSKYWYACGW